MSAAFFFEKDLHLLYNRDSRVLIAIGAVSAKSGRQPVDTSAPSGGKRGK